MPKYLNARLFASPAAAKADALVARGVVTLAADTLIAMDHERIGKPKDADDARAMLRRLRQPHDVRTEIAIVGANGAADAIRGSLARTPACERSGARGLRGQRRAAG
jgi:predicted house-cleaning NTP pyrophosphatase (Maf/HAM1 superfamily)